MTKTDKYKLLKFITRIGMFVYPVDEHNITSFVHGYEYGKRQSGSFTEQIRERLSDQYKMFHSSDGWQGQIKRLAAKRKENWATIFRWITLEILADKDNGGWDNTMSEILKPRIFSLIERIHLESQNWMDESWIQNWLSLCPVQSDWFQHIWEDKEWRIIKPINKKLLMTGALPVNQTAKKLLNLKALLK